ncbi:MAG: hypothetical protein AB7P00_40880, partial [Sandaracinaceae bacterium]
MKSCRVLAPLLAFVFVGCQPAVECGDGTILVGSRCVAGGLDAGPRRVDAGDRPDAGGVDGGTDDAGLGGTDGGPPRDAAPSTEPVTCASSCDCPEQYVCTIEGVCDGFAGCVAPCTTDTDCACGRACVDGHCLYEGDVTVGSRVACSEDCECPRHRERCIAGQCLRACELGSGCPDCAPCGAFCTITHSICTLPGDCHTHQDCIASGVGELCTDFTGGVCERPAGTAYSLGDLTFSLVPDPYDTSHWRYSGSVTVTSPLSSVMVTIVLDSLTFAGAPVADCVDCTLVSPTGVSV